MIVPFACLRTDWSAGKKEGRGAERVGVEVEGTTTTATEPPRVTNQRRSRLLLSLCFIFALSRANPPVIFSLAVVRSAMSSGRPRVQWNEGKDVDEREEERRREREGVGHGAMTTTLTMTTSPRFRSSLAAASFALLCLFFAATHRDNFLLSSYAESKNH